MNYRDDIKAIAFDFDGTLIDSDYQASDYTIRALQLLKQKDYKIVLASGRPCFLALKAFKDVFGEYPLDYIFGCNGSEFYDVRKDESRILHPLKAEEVRRIGNIITCDFLIAGIYEGDRLLVNQLPESDDIIRWIKARWLTPVLFDFAENTADRSKVILLNNDNDREKEDEFLASVDLSKYNYFYSSGNCLEITPKGVSKALSCRYLAKLLDCEMEQILSFGDNENDMEMLNATTGVIMDNAREDLKQKIKLHTGRVEEEGIYTFLSRNGLI